MGEIEQLDMGSEPIAQGTVQIPTEEHIVGFGIAMTKTDRKWSSFKLTTDQREIEIEPGKVGQAQFDTFCGEVKAMFGTTEGAAVLAKLKQLLAARPLTVNTVTTE